MLHIGKLIEALGLRELFLYNPDPLRYQEYARATMPANWHGDLETQKPNDKKSGAVCLDTSTNTWGFVEDINSTLAGRIRPTLTQEEKNELSRKGYSPNNSQYAVAKKHYYDMKGETDKHDMSRVCGLSPDTMKDAIAIFRRCALTYEPSPSP